MHNYITTIARVPSQQCVKGPIASTPSSCARPNVPEDAFTKMIKNQQEIVTDRWHRREYLSGEPVGLIDVGESGQPFPGF
jgi:hypothetical protein